MAQPNSRYASVGEATFTSEGHTVVYLRRRILPDPEAQKGASVSVRPGERADLVAARSLGAPTQFHRLCDANNIADPFEIAEGERTQLALPKQPAGPGDNG